MTSLLQVLNLNTINNTKQLLHKHFHIKDLGTLKYFLGKEVARRKTGIHINQRKYTLDILTKAGLLGCKPASTSMNRAIRLTITDGQPLSDPTKHRRLVGQLIYLLNTRPNISYSVQELSLHMSKPTDMHYNAAIRVLRYLKSSPAQGLFFPTNSCLQLKAFFDFDWATCPETRKSITGFCI